MIRPAVDHNSPSKWGQVNLPADTRSTAVEWDPSPFAEEWRSKEFTVPTVLVFLGSDAHAIPAKGRGFTYDELIEAVKSRFSASDVHFSTTALRWDQAPEYRRSYEDFERVFQTISTTRIEQGSFDKGLLLFLRRISALSERLGERRLSRRGTAPAKPRTKGVRLVDRIRAASESVPQEEWDNVPRDLSAKFEEYLYRRGKE